jgi:hypothetical protein
MVEQDLTNRILSRCVKSRSIVRGGRQQGDQADEARAGSIPSGHLKMLESIDTVAAYR